MNFCPHCGHDLRSFASNPAPLPGEPIVAERVPTLNELLKPISPARTRGDFATDEAWQEHLNERAKVHREKLLQHARDAWEASGPTVAPEDDALLVWFARSAKQDGSSRITLENEWCNDTGSLHCHLTDAELVAWKRAKREEVARGQSDE